MCRSLLSVIPDMRLPIRRRVDFRIAVHGGKLHIPVLCAIPYLNIPAGQRAQRFRRHPADDDPRRHDLLLYHNGALRDDGVFADLGIETDDRAHADTGRVRNGAGVDDCPVPNRHAAANDALRAAAATGVNDDALLYGGLRSDTDPRGVGADDGVWADEAARPDLHVADEYCLFAHEGRLV